MSPEEVVRELTMLSFPVPLHTFNYWLRGYFLPRSESAFQLVGILEHILGISDNRLSDALLEDLSSGSSFVPGEFVPSENIAMPPPPKRLEARRFSSTADESIDWEANIIQKVVRDELYLSADHKYLRYKVTILARVPSVPDPTFFFQILHEDGITTGREDYFYDISGMSLKKQDVFEENGMTICAAQFALPDDVIPGDLHKFSYAWDEKSEEPMVKIGERLLSWTLDFYSFAVTFEGGIPDGVRYVTREPVGDTEIEIPNNIPVMCEGNTLRVSTKNFGSIVGYLEVPLPTESRDK
ncbi:MAG: hypothetical protein IKS49_01015 [Actinomycetaceae bacterium]|nr:hypothetical protein [Actinomycetaceae bacterium]